MEQLLGSQHMWSKTRDAKLLGVAQPAALQMSGNKAPFPRAKEAAMPLVE